MAFWFHLHLDVTIVIEHFNLYAGVRVDRLDYGYGSIRDSTKCTRILGGTSTLFWRESPEHKSEITAAILKSLRDFL